MNFFLLAIIIILIKKLSFLSKEILLAFGLIEKDTSFHEYSFFNGITSLMDILLTIYLFWLIFKFRKMLNGSTVNTFFSKKMQVFLKR